MARVVNVLRARRRSVVISAIALVVVITAAVLVYQKEAVGVFFRSGEAMKVDFQRDYRLIPDSSVVKVAGIEVGVVTDTGRGDNGQSVVSLKVDQDAVDRLGSDPSAAIRPVTILGGKYFVELIPGGKPGSYDTGKAIPANRTTVPVELDKILGALTQPARTGIQSTVRQLDGTLNNGGRQALGNLVADAPGTFQPAGPVLSALQGTRPSTDLPQLVTNLDSLAQVLTQRDGQLGDIVDSLDQTSVALAAGKDGLADTLHSLPQTLQSTREGLGPLQVSLTKLTSTAAKFRPAAQRLAPLLDKTEPVLQQALPLVHDLRPLLQQAKPLVQELVPTSAGLTQTLDDVRGPVLDRVNGPISNVINSPWVGTGYYAGDGGNNHLFYQELGYLAAHAANLSKYGDKNGQMVGLALGVGASSIGGTDQTLEKLLENIGALPPGTAESPPPGWAQSPPAGGTGNPQSPPASSPLVPLPLPLPLSGGPGLSGLLSGTGNGQ